jgi:pyruvate/2-oxoglutarate dehydrogenase complex dihydrolipoamide dehydrogenase (E3) component
MPGTFEVQPMDAYNQTLVANVHPADWKNPKPAAKYNLVVIGGGTAGLVAAGGTALLGGKVALIERDLLGGDCLNTGCVPSKALIRAAHAANTVQEAGRFGVEVSGKPTIHFDKVMEHVRRARAEISPHDSAQRFKDWGTDVFLGEAKFLDEQSVCVDGQVLRFQKAIIATGARATRPNIPGLEQAGYLTNETLFTLTEQPKRLAIIGGGPIGCEMAQAFARLGTQVTILHKSDSLLGKEDPDVSTLLENVFQREGIGLALEATVKSVEISETGKILYFTIDNQEMGLEVDAILVSVGRTPNVEQLNLEAAGVAYEEGSGVIVDDFLRTTNARIYACGDVCMSEKFTHAADAAARIAIQNALFFGQQRLSQLVIPRCTYTDPEIAHVGLTVQAAEQQGYAVETLSMPFSEADRAVTEDEQTGFIKIHLKLGTDRILGATIITRHAGELISEVTTAIVAKKGLSSLAKVIHPYPTRAEIIRKVADEYSLKQLQGLKWLTQALLNFTRGKN